MSFTILKTDGSTLAIITSNSVNTTSSDITLHGQGFLTYGKALNENLVHILENFASSTPPSNPLLGQLWAEKTGSPEVTGLKYYVGGSPAWAEILTTAAGTAGFVNTTGDIMSGTLTINDTTALIANGNVDVTGNVDITGTTDFHGNVNLDGTDIMSFGNDFTITGLGGTSSPQHATIETTATNLDINAYHNMVLTYNVSNTSSQLILRDGVSGDDTFNIDPAGNISTAGQVIRVGRLHNADQNSYIDFYAAMGTGSPVSTWRGRILRSPGNNNVFDFRQKGSSPLRLITEDAANIQAWRSGVNKLDIGASVTGFGGNRLTGIGTATAASDAVRYDQLPASPLTGWVSYPIGGAPGQRDAGINYQNTSNRPLIVTFYVSNNTGNGGGSFTFYTGPTNPAPFFISSVWGTHTGHSMTYIVKPGDFYRLDGPVTTYFLNNWLELV